MRAAAENESDSTRSFAGSPSGLVARARLIDRLRGSRAAPVVVLTAPAGYSKSTSLALWDEVDERPFCWLRCQVRHDDPSTLVAAIVESLGPVHPVDSGILLALNSPTPDPATVLDRLGRALGEIEDPFVLVVDDAHNLRAGGTSEVLATLVENLPENSQLAIGTRTRPGLPLGRLRANRELVELGISDLAMTRGEAAELLETLGLRLDSEEADRIHERTEGWPAAMYLAGLVLRGDEGGLTVAPASFSGDDRVVVEYFRDEFFAGLSEEQAHFLYSTSILDELSGPLCDSVLDRGGSATMLVELAASNAMVIPLDRGGRRFRYHHLFADMLRAELRLREPEAESELHRRASRWYDGEGNLEKAVDHAIAGGDTGLAGDQIWRSFPELSGHGRMATLDRWVEELGDRRIKTSVPIMLAMAHHRLIAGHGGEAFQWTALAAEAASGPGSAGGHSADFDLLNATFAVNGLERMTTDADNAVAGLERDVGWQVPAHLYAGVGRHLSGRPAEAEPLLRESARLGAKLAPIMQTVALCQLAIIGLEAGRTDEAALLASQARRQVENCGLKSHGSQLLVYAVSALIRAREGRAEDARADVDWGRHLLKELNQLPPWYETEGRIFLGRACLRLGDVDSATQFLAEARRGLEEVPDAPVLREWVDSTEASIASAREGLLTEGANLTKSELRTLRFLPSHHSFRAIGEQLHLSQNTVKTQANSLYRKLGANSRAEAVMIARRTGLLDPEPGAAGSPGSDDGADDGRF